MNPLDLTSPTEKVALVIRAGTPLGQAIALALAHAGWDVALHDDQTPQIAQTLASSIRYLGRRTALLYANLNNAQQTTQLIADCAKELDLPTCLVYQATDHRDEATTFNYALFDAQVRINSSAPILLAHTLHQAILATDRSNADRSVVIPILKKNRNDCRHGGDTISSLSNTLSQAPLQAAIPLLARTLAATLRVVGIAIEEENFSCINTIAPRAHLGDMPQQISQAHVKSPVSTYQDVADSVCFLASAPAITGTLLLADHGHHLLVADQVPCSHRSAADNTPLTNP